MANLIIVAGPQAVGKMTVAEELQERLGYSLMTNHDSIELSLKIFGNGTPAQKELNNLIRENVFEVAAKNNINMIFTFVAAFNMQEDIDYLNQLQKMFEDTGGSFYFVELEADVETRLERNVTPHRLEQKPSKKNIDWSNQELVDSMDIYRFNTEDGEMICPNHIKINNMNLGPDEVADMVIQSFHLDSLKENETHK